MVASSIPNFNQLPSVLSYNEVEAQYVKIMNIADEHVNPPIYAIQDALNEGIFSLEYNPKGKFGNAIIQRITNWIESHWYWEKGDREFVDGLVSIYINVASNSEAKAFFESTLAADKRGFVQEELRDVLSNDIY